MYQANSLMRSGCDRSSKPGTVRFRSSSCTRLLRGHLLDDVLADVVDGEGALLHVAATLARVVPERLGEVPDVGAPAHLLIASEGVVPVDLVEVPVLLEPVRHDEVPAQGRLRPLLVGKLLEGYVAGVQVDVRKDLHG